MHNLDPHSGHFPLNPKIAHEMNMTELVKIFIKLLLKFPYIIEADDGAYCQQFRCDIMLACTIKLLEF